MNLPWRSCGPLDDGLCFNYGVVDKWGVLIVRCDNQDQADDIALWSRMWHER